MIPEKIVRFLHEQANIAFAGTRDRNLVPLGHRVSGWRVAPDGRTLIALLPDATAGPFLEAMADNGQVAVVVEQASTHETYQLKGRYLGHRPVNPDEIESAARVRGRFVEGLRPLYPDRGLAELMGGSIPSPSMAIDVEVHEIFLQTPGPGAGSRLWPATD